MEEALLLFTSTLLGGWFITRRLHSALVKSRCLGLILGTAVGDAKGIPYENLTYDEVRELIQKNNVTEDSVFEQCGETNPYIPAFYGPGKWTDDTQLSLAMAWAIVRTKDRTSRKVDIQMIVEEHVSAWKERLIGWGGTRTAIERLANQTHDYYNCGNADAVGNGVLMKLCPLALYYAMTPSSSLISLEQKRELVDLTRMTHGTPQAAVTALVLCTFEEMVYRDTNLLNTKEQRQQLLKEIINLSKKYEAEFQPNEVEWKNLLSSRLEQILTAMESNNLTDSTLVAASNGGTFYCIDSASMVIGILMTDKPSFKMIQKAAYIGGDCDSNAAIVGGVIGGILGYDMIPPQYISSLEQSERLVNAATQLADALV